MVIVDGVNCAKNQAILAIALEGHTQGHGVTNVGKNTLQYSGERCYMTIEHEIKSPNSAVTGPVRKAAQAGYFYVMNQKEKHRCQRIQK